MDQLTTAKCYITNKTGANIIYQISNDWQGSVGDSSYHSYPKTIQPGDTATFQHVGNPNGSQGAVVYRVPSVRANKPVDVLLAWFNPPNLPNKAYTSVDVAGAFTNDGWPSVFAALISEQTVAQRSSTKEGITSVVEIENGNFPKFSATISPACSTA